MKRLLALVLLCAAPAFAEREVFAPTKLAPTATAGIIQFGDGTQAAPSMTFASDPDTGVYRFQSNVLGFATGGSVRAMIDNSRRLIMGNGTDSSSPSGGSVTTTSGNGTDIAGASLTIAAGNSTGTASGGSLIFQTAAAGGVSGTTANTLTERMRITSAGRVGINTAAPDRALHLVGTDAITATFRITRASNNWDMGVSAGGNLVFTGSSSGETLTLTSGGNVIIGNGDTAASPATTVLRGTNASGTDIAAADFTITGGRGTGTGAGGAITFSTAAAGTTGSSLNAATERMRINSSGDVFVGNGETASSVANGNIRATGGSGTNINGADLVLHGGRSTGNASGGNLRFFTAAAGSAGSSINASTERMRIDSQGRVMIGSTSTVSIGGGDPVFQVNGIDQNTSNTSLTRFSANASGPYIQLGKSRGATVGTQTVVSNDDRIGGIQFNGSDGSDLNQGGALIEAAVDGTPAANSIPGRLQFFTTAAAGTTPTERLRINSSGDVFVGNGPTNASPIEGPLRATGGSGSNIAGANMLIAGGQGTGTGAGGVIRFSTAAAGSSGSSPNSLTERVRIKQGGQVRFVPLAADPTLNVEDGDVYYNSATNKLRVRAAGSWVDLH